MRMYVILVILADVDAHLFRWSGAQHDAPRSAFMAQIIAQLIMECSFR